MRALALLGLIFAGGMAGSVTAAAEGWGRVAVCAFYGVGAWAALSGILAIVLWDRTVEPAPRSDD